MTASDIEAFLTQHFPQAHIPRVEHVDGKTARLRLPFDKSQLRPGGTVSGPTMMGLADTAMYALVLSALGEVALAVTSNLSIHFLEKPPPADLVAEAQLLRLGATMAVGEVSLRSADGGLCAHAVVTYAIPRR